MDSFEHYRRFVNLTLLVKRNPFQFIKEFYGWSHPLCIKDDSSSAFLQLKTLKTVSYFALDSFTDSFHCGFTCS